MSSPWKFIPQDIQIWCPHEFDLSGSAIEVPFYHQGQNVQPWGNRSSTCRGIVTDIFVVYTEASSADAGVAVSIGDATTAAFFYSFTSEISQSQWDSTTYSGATLSNERFFTSNNDVLTVTCAGGKTGTGAVRVGVNISFNYEDWSGFTV